MMFINKKYLIILAIIIVISFFLATQFAVVCWDTSVNKEELMQVCGVTPEEYWQKFESNSSFCPEGLALFKQKGGCSLDWGIVIMFLLFVLIIYNLIYSVIYFVSRKNKYKKRDKK